MKVTEIDSHQTQAIARYARPDSDPNPQKKHRGMDISPSSQDDNVQLHDGNGDFSIQKLEKVNSIISNVAESIRTADDTMESIKQTLKSMEAELYEIKKQYPPFPPGSNERVEYLKRFSALRRQIDALAFGPPHEGAGEIMGDGKNAGSTINFGDKHFPIGIRRQPVHSGPDGLNITDLPHNADDDQINDTINTVAKAMKVLNQRRTELAEDVANITFFKIQ
jgi:hypothetical protein